MTAARDWKKDRERWEAIRSIIQASEFAEGFVPAAFDEIERFQGLIDRYAAAHAAYHGRQFGPDNSITSAFQALADAKLALLAAASKPEGRA